MIHLLLPLTTDHAAGIHGAASLPDYGRVSTRADSAEAGPSPSSMQECRAGRDEDVVEDEGEEKDTQQGLIEKKKEGSSVVEEGTESS